LYKRTLKRKRAARSSALKYLVNTQAGLAACKYNISMLRNHPLFQTLRELKGNPRITVLTEVMFGIPYNLFTPFFSVYMLALGLTDQQIGTVASLGLVLQIFTALLSGVIVDK